MGLLDFLSPEAGQRRTRALNEKIGEVLSYYLGPTGIPERANAAAMMNPIQDIYEAGGNMRDGNYGAAAVNTASALVPVGAARIAGGGAMDDVANVISDTLTGVGTRAAGAMDAGQGFVADEFGGVGPSKGIRAYHGSPHDFDRFSMDAIGTGEGAQAYGHGLYFAENEAVARGYRDALTKNVDPRSYWELGGHRIGGGGLDLAKRYLDDAGGEVSEALRGMSAKVGAGVKPWARADYDDALRALQLTEAGQIRPISAGRMYEVNINANPDDFLDWDAPLSEQPRVAERMGYSDRDIDTYNRSMRAGDDNILDALFNDAPLDNTAPDPRLRPLGQTGEQIVSGGQLWSDKVTPSQTMAEQGIPGIKYRDAGSRGMDGDSGTRNFVVFDENLIEIVRKYGIAGAAIFFGMSEAEVQERMNGT